DRSFGRSLFLFTYRHGFSARRSDSHRSAAPPACPPISSRRFERLLYSRLSECFRLNVMGRIDCAVSVADASFFVLPYLLIAYARPGARTNFCRALHAAIAVTRQRRALVLRTAGAICRGI